MPRYGSLTFDWRSSIVGSAGDVRAERDGRDAVHSHADLNRLKRVALFVGPENGLSDAERATLDHGAVSALRWAWGARQDRVAPRARSRSTAWGPGVSRTLLWTVARIVLVGLTSAACRATEPGVTLERDAALKHVTSDATPETDAPAAAVIGADASATATAKCRTAVELQREFIDEEPHPLVPGLDLDGDGKNDPVFVVAQGGPRVLLLYVEKAGCARQIGTVRASDPKTVRILGRDKAGWAIVHGATPFTFDEIEEKLIYEGPRYVVWTRQRDYPLPAPGKKRTVSAWSPWTREEREDSGTEGAAKWSGRLERGAPCDLPVLPDTSESATTSGGLPRASATEYHVGP